MVAVSKAEIKASKKVWDEWRAAGKPYPLPTVPELLSMEECAAAYGTYDTPQGPVPILAPGVQLTDFTCLCGRTAPQYLEYDGYLVCSKDCGALYTDASKFDDSYREEAKKRQEAAEKVQELEAEIAKLKASMAS